MTKVKVGVIGVGLRGSGHVRIIQGSDRGEVIAVCDVDKDRLKRFEEQYKNIKTYTDYHRLLKDAEVEAVDIVLPHNLHAQVAIAAANAKKHILVEKPISRTLEEADAMIAAAKKNRVKLSVAEDRRYNAHWALAKQLIDEGKIGEPYAAQGDSRFYGRPYEVKPGETAVAATVWRGKKEAMGGGVLIDEGHHGVDLLIFLLGEIVEASAYWSRKGLGEKSEGEDTTLSIFKHRNGAISYNLSGWGPGPHRETMIVYGTKGAIDVDSETVKLYTQDITVLPMPDRRRPTAEELMKKSAEERALFQQLNPSVQSLVRSLNQHQIKLMTQLPSLDAQTKTVLETLAARTQRIDAPAQVWTSVELRQEGLMSGMSAAIHQFLEAVQENKEPKYPGEEGRRVLAAIVAAYEPATKAVSIKTR